MTTITGRLLDASGTGVAGLPIRAVLIAAENVTISGEVVRSEETESASDGSWSLDLVPISWLVEPDGAYYIVRVPGSQWTINVPDSGTHAIHTVLIVPGPLPSTGATQASLDAHEAETTTAHSLASVYLALTGGTLTGDLTISDPGVKGYRLRRSGSDLDFEGTGKSMVFSVWSGAAFSGTQRFFLALSDASQEAKGVGLWTWRETVFGAVRHQINPSTGVAGMGSKNGLTTINLCGFKATSGAPSTGTWDAGDLIIDSDGVWHLCTAGGTPGTWT